LKPEQDFYTALASNSNNAAAVDQISENYNTIVAAPACTVTVTTSTSYSGSTPPGTTVNVTTNATSIINPSASTPAATPQNIPLGVLSSAPNAKFAQGAESFGDYLSRISMDAAIAQVIITPIAPEAIVPLSGFQMGFDAGAAASYGAARIAGGNTSAKMYGAFASLALDAVPYSKIINQAVNTAGRWYAPNSGRFINAGNAIINQIVGSGFGILPPQLINFYGGSN
jgi:hypothetical protein